MLDALEVVGIAILAGFIAARFIVQHKVPAVAAYVLIGIILGPSVLNIFHEDMLMEIGVLNDIALGFIAFLIGGELQWRHLKSLGKTVFAIVILEAFGAFFVVTAVLQLLFHQWPVSLLLGAIASATAPAATVMVIQELRAKGSFTRTLLAIVAIDDAIALIIYSFASVIVRMMLAPSCDFQIFEVCLGGVAEVFISVAIGFVAALTVSPVIKALRKNEDILVVAIGSFFVITGLADQLGFSILLANIMFGIVLVNAIPIASRKVFNMINSFIPPLFIAFFVTAGAHLRLDLIPKIWLIGLAYLLARVVGKLSGASLGAVISNAEPKIRKYIGFGLISQVGVALGLALVVTREFAPLGSVGKDLSSLVINVLLATTIFTEIIGPILTRRALIKTGEANIGK